MKVGAIEGGSVGFFVGSIEGPCVGMLLGAAEGSRIGIFVIGAGLGALLEAGGATDSSLSSGLGPIVAVNRTGIAVGAVTISVCGTEVGVPRSAGESSLLSGAIPERMPGPLPLQLPSPHKPAMITTTPNMTIKVQKVGRNQLR